MAKSAVKRLTVKFVVKFVFLTEEGEFNISECPLVSLSNKVANL